MHLLVTPLHTLWIQLSRFQLEGQSKFCFKIYCCPAFRHFVPPFFIVFLCTNLTLKYLSFIENHVSSVENHVKALPMVRFVAKQQFICQALGVVARI